MAQMQVATAVVAPPPPLAHFRSSAPAAPPWQRAGAGAHEPAGPPQGRIPEGAARRHPDEPPLATHIAAGDSAIVQSILDSIQVGAMAVAGGLRVSFANRAAVRECHRLGLMRIEDAQVAVLALADASQRQRLADAVAAAHGGQWSMVRLGSGATALSIAVFPLLCQHERGTGPLALLLFGLSGKHEPLAIQLYAKSCGLTPAETRVLLGLAEGLVPKQIATRNEVLLSTVRTQISSIRDKTGTRRLADLMQALVTLPPIMPASLGRA